METDSTYIVILGWMRHLDLSLVERTVYAIIYGFSQDGDSTFHGSRQYLADWCGCTTKTIDAALRTLVEKDYITKREKHIGGVKFCEYSVNFPSREKISPVGKYTEVGGEKISVGREKISHNNIDNNANTDVFANNDSTAQARAFNFKKALLDLGISEQVAADWMTVRKAKKATNTETAFHNLRTQIEKICKRYDTTPDEVARFAVGKDWKGINADWEEVKNIKNNAQRIGTFSVPNPDDYIPF